VGTGGEFEPRATGCQHGTNFHPEFAQGKVDPVDAGKKGGNTQGDGSASSGGSDGGSDGKGQFAGGKVDPVEAGKKGGKS